MDICLFGPQGSGKGTQGKILAEKYGLKTFVMGDQLRATIASGSPLGQKIKAVVESGDLVSDEIIMEMVEAYLDTLTSTDRVLFDGIPRTKYQADALIELLKKHGRDLMGLLVDISEKEAIVRLTQRRICSNCKEIYPASYQESACKLCGSPLVVRQDDSDLKSIQKRLDHYQKETMPVIEAFKEADHLVVVNGEQSIEQVSAEMMKKIDFFRDSKKTL